MADNFDYSVVDAIIDELGAVQSSVIAILQGVQEHYHYLIVLNGGDKHYHYLQREIFPHMAKRIGVSEVKIYSVATFYENFSLEPKGKFVIKVCDGTACHVRKSIPILERLRSELGLSDEKSTTDDLGFTVETVSCLGACGLAPVITVNDQVYPSMTPDKASELLAQLKKEV